jgi:hypothetical protein
VTERRRPDPAIPVVQLALFEGGLTWAEILAVNGLGKRWWSNAVIRAETCGLLAWRTQRGGFGRWTLTAKGRAYVAANAAGEA